ncbi:MAG TPA: SPOR domain-containing protein [Deltaproteobacteria bacterium]|mgnify:CR=1 FL=1|nr:SPOR domain-containing protein [Deltaproteobacteria bacterium]
MASRNSRDFEFKLGKLGLVLFTFGNALLLLFSFIFGVMVGKNIESYPEKIAKGIPQAIKEKITDTSNRAFSSVTGTPELQDTQKDEEQKKQESVELDFYKKLTEKDHDVIKPSPTVKSSTRHTTPQSGDYIIQVASFKDRNRMENLKDRLTAMGYTPKIDETDLTAKGTWFRVTLTGFQGRQEAGTAATHLETKIRGLKCMVIRKK